MTRKKYLSLPIFALCALSLASCGGTSTSSSTPTSSSGTSEKTSSSVEEDTTCTVTFDLNYDGGGTYQTLEVEPNSNVTRPDDPTRDGYVFENWYTEATCENVFDFDTAISDDITIYANWSEFDSENMIKVVFYYNYEGAPNNGIYMTSVIKKRRKVSTPSKPTRDEAYFENWYTDSDCTTLYSFDTILSESTNLYANWLDQYVFEAEYVDFTGKAGMGYSGNTEDTNMISKDSSGAGASNGYYVSWLYYNGANLEFNLECSEAVENVVFVARLSVEYYDMAFTDETLSFTVNDVALTGFSIDLSGAYTVGTEGIRAFQDYLISTKASFSKGSNVVKMTVTNNNSHGGTMQADAPVVDCLKLATNDATLSWGEGYPKTSNVK